MDISREQALSILGLGPSATDAQAARAYTRRKRPLKRKLVRAVSVGLKNEYRGRLRELVLARDAALGRSDVDERTRKVTMSERPLLESLEGDTLDRAQAMAVLGLEKGVTDAAVKAAHTERYRFLTQRLGRARDDRHLEELRTARLRLLGVRRFLLERTETFDLTSILAKDFDEEDPEVISAPVEPDAAQERLRRAFDVGNDGAENPLEETLPDELDGETTRMSFLPESPEPDVWEGDADQIRAAFERLVQPLRERMAAADSEELRAAYEQAIVELQRKRDAALRLHVE